MGVSYPPKVQPHISPSVSFPFHILFPSDTGQVVMEHWNPVGVVGVITAFNYPMLVYGLTQAMALVCGNTVIW